MEYEIPVIGLCAYCLMNVNAADPICVGYSNRGRAKDAEGCELHLPDGSVFEWKPGNLIPPGSHFVVEIARLFGTEASFVHGPGYQLPMFAVTIREGTMVCYEHNRRSR